MRPGHYPWGIHWISTFVGGLVAVMAMENRGFARQDLVPGSRYTSGRAAALGDAFLPLGDDAASGLFYNPANLGKIRKREFEFFNLSTNFNLPYLSMIDTNSTNVIYLSGFLPNLQAHPGSFSNAGASFFPNMAFPGFAFGVLMQAQVAGQANADGTVTYRSLYQLIPTIGTGFRVLNGLVRFGGSLQWVNQASGGGTVAADDPALGYNQGLAQGSALSSMLGVAISLPIFLHPSFNFVARNILSAVYNPFSLLQFTPNPTGTPATEPMTLDVAFSLQPRIGNGGGVNIVIEDRDFARQTSETLMLHLAIGVEVVFSNSVFLRGGYGSGYPSGGLGLRRKGAEMSLTYYSEELGPTFMSQQDSKILLQYQLRNF